MAAVARGDLARMSEIYQAWRRPLFRFFYRLSGRCAAAEDLVHEVFLRMIRFRATYQTERQTADQSGIFEAWMYRIARNTFADYTRRQRLETNPGEAGLEGVESGRPTPFDFAARRQDLSLLYRALRQLPIDKREVLILTRFEGLSHLLVIGLIAVTAALAFPRSWAKETRDTVHHTFSGDKTLEVRNLSGAIKVLGDSESTIGVDAKRNIGAQDERQLERARKDVKLDLSD